MRRVYYILRWQILIALLSMSLYACSPVPIEMGQQMTVNASKQFLHQSDNSPLSGLFELGDAILTADDNGMAVVSGENSSGSMFQIRLNYKKDDINLRNTYFIDFTGDEKKELCLEMNIWNSVSPDLNTIVVYDMEKEEILFPTNDKSFIYDGTIGQNAIEYTSYTKFNGITVEDEKSTIVWRNESFETLEYQNKLLIETDKYIVFYNKNSSDQKDRYKLVILDPNTLETMQEIELKMNEAEITENIKNHELVKRINNELYDVYIKGYGIICTACPQ